MSAAGKTTGDIIVLGKFEQEKLWDKEELLKMAVCVVQLHHSPPLDVCVVCVLV